MTTIPRKPTRTPVSRVTGGDTSHYTMTDRIYSTRVKAILYRAFLLVMKSSS